MTDEHYQDGIKLPMNKESDSDRGLAQVCYRQYDDLFNQVAALSMKLNVMQSDLREFEKQKVEPIAKDLDKWKNAFWELSEQVCRVKSPVFNAVLDRLTHLEEVLPRYDELHKEQYDRLEKLEIINKPQTLDNAQRNYAILRDKVNKLEPELKSLQKYISDCDKARFDACADINIRIDEYCEHSGVKLDKKPSKALLTMEEIDELVRLLKQR